VIRVVLPAHLKTLAQVSGEVELDVDVAQPVTQRRVLDALEAEYPVLRGRIRDQVNQRRRPFVRFFVGEEDRSHDDPDDALPESIATGSDRFYVIGAMAGG
jgi:molybdopterin synthase sulfur carrier subunit